MRYAIHITGTVQGVGFRHTVGQAAQVLGLSGWVQNEWDGSVSIEAQGTAAAMHRFLEEIRSGNRWAQVESLDCTRQPEQAGETDFTVRY